MTLLILQMLGLLVLAALLGWLIGRWKVANLLAERDELHELRMRSRFKKIEALKQSLSASHTDPSMVDLEVHRMLEDRYHQLKQDHTRAQQLLHDNECKLSKTQDELQELEQDLHEADQSLAKRDLELSTLQQMIGDLQSAQTEVAGLQDQVALLGAAKEKSERNADVLKQVYYRMRDRFREADARAQHWTEVSREQAVSVAEDSANTARLLREKRELEERLEKNECVTRKLRTEFNKHFVLSARLQEALKGQQQQQLSGAQLAIDRPIKRVAEPLRANAKKSAR